MDVTITNSLMVKLLVLLMLLMSGCSKHPDSTSQLDSKNIEVQREKHHFSHWKWSGIFPFEGGFIPDPHFYVTEPFEFPLSLEQQLKSKRARYQGVDINPWFKDKTSEIILAIEIDSNVYEFKIDNSKKQKMDYGFINFNGRINTFIYDNKLAFITTLDVSRLAILTVDLPITKNAIIEPIYKGEAEYKNIVNYLSMEKRFKVLKSGMCSQYKPYIEFYEQFESCPPLPAWKPKRFD